jgi:hypothetical protein
VSITTDLDAIRARWDEVVASTAFGDLASTQLDAALMSASDVPFLLDLVEELRRQVKVWKGKAE